MAQSTLKKVKLNFIFGLFGQVITIILGLLLPRFFILSFGSEVNGYIKGLDQIFVYVALLEAGVGTASLRALYAPAGKGNRDEMNSILAATNQYYRKTGLAYLIIIAALSFVYPLLIRTELNYWLMMGLFLIIGGSGAIPYFSSSKYAILLSADGKEYINSILTVSTQILLSIGKIIAILCGANVILVQAIYLAINFLRAAITTIYVKKKYKWINLKAAPDKTALSQKNSVLLHQISSLIFNNTDTLILTFFCSLTTASIYALYKALISMIGVAINMISNSMNFAFGQSFEDRERFLRLHNAFETFHVTLTFSLCTVALVFIKPFMALYTAGMDANYVIDYLPLLFIAVEILSYGRLPTQNVITYAGHFKQTQVRSFIESGINLVSSLVLVYFMNIHGVLLGTVLALFYRTNDIIIYVNKKILMCSPFKTYRIWLINIAFSLVFLIVFNSIPFSLDSYFNVILWAAVVCIIVIPLQIMTGFLAQGREGISYLKTIKNVVLRRGLRLENTIEQKNESDIKLSVIVPCYNSEKYLGDCLQSLLNQELSSELYQIICVDDGSTDATLSILKEYAADSRVKVFSKENGGVSSARNYGMTKAEGEYLWFVDSDDIVAPNCIKRLVDLLILESPQMLGIGMTFFDAEQAIQDVGALSYKKSEYVNCHACENVYRKDIVDQYAITYDEKIKYGEDTLFAFSYYSKMQGRHLLQTSQNIYYYRVNEGSAMVRANLPKEQIRRIRDLISQCIALKELLQAQKDKKKRKIINHRLKIQLECLLYLLPPSGLEYGSVVNELKEKGLYPYGIMWRGIFERKRKGYSLKNALIFYSFPFEFLYKKYFKIRQKGLNK